MGEQDKGQITEILAAMKGGKRDALHQLFPIVYDRLRRIARNKMAREPAQTLQTTALVHEVYLRLLDDKEQSWENRRHFFAVAAEAMRRILVENARKRATLKRGGNGHRIPLNENMVAVCSNPDLFLMFDRGLELLEAQDPRMSDVVKLRCFAGLTVEETAETLGISSRNVDRLWAAAKAWLYHNMNLSANGF